ncbi:MAG: DUF2917 domain-containing protein [Betaproteobacteria bacterium]
MNKPITDYKARARLVKLSAREAVTITAHRGTEVRVIEGQVWITQEGDGEDYIVAAGTRFCSGAAGSIVASALSESSRISISWTDPAVAGAYARSGVWLDYAQVAAVEDAARQARARELSRLARAGWTWLKRGWHSFTRRRRAVTRLAAR